jgi:glucose/arabinose dehydrogenase
MILLVKQTNFALHLKFDKNKRSVPTSESHHSLALRKFLQNDMIHGKMKISRIIILLIVLLPFLPNACSTQVNTPPRVALQLIGSGFTSPVAMVTPHNGSDRLFVVDQVGVIWIIEKDKRIEEPFLDLRAKIVELNDFYDERGLLGLAFHPDFATNGRFYVSYSAALRQGSSASEWDHTTYISEFKVSANNSNQADPTSERIILAMDKPGYNYEAGHIAFGPDGYLYIATGDSVRDPASEAGQYAQDTFSLLGKILRIDINGTVDSTQNYLIPLDNPFVNGGGIAEVYAYGFRNPYRFSFDGSRLFVADVGQARIEEVDLVESGKNYGWPIREGTSCFNSQRWDQPLTNCPTDGLIDPIIAYTHNSELSAVIGGAVYHGKSLLSLQDDYVFGDWGRGDGRLFIAHPPIFGRGPWKVTEIQIEHQNGIGQLLGIGQDDEDELYLLTKDPGIGPIGNSGKLYKLVPPNP